MKIVGYLVLVKYDDGLEKTIFDHYSELVVFLHQVEVDTSPLSVEIQTIYSHIN